MRADKILPTGVVVHVTTMIGDGRRYLTAWERTDAPAPRFYRHSAIAHFDGLPGCYGQIGTDALPPEIDALPRGEERSSRCAAWRRGCELRAHAAILEAFPEAAQGDRRVGSEIACPTGRCMGCGGADPAHNAEGGACAALPGH